MYEMHDKWERGDHIRGRNQGLGWKKSREDEGVEGKVFGREIKEKWEKKKKKIALKQYIEKRKIAWVSTYYDDLRYEKINLTHTQS